jgi:hypothetical protein
MTIEGRGALQDFRHEARWRAHEEAATDASGGGRAYLVLALGTNGRCNTAAHVTGTHLAIGGAIPIHQPALVTFPSNPA